MTRTLENREELIIQNTFSPLIEMTANEMRILKESGDENKMKELVNYKTQFKEFLLRINSKVDDFQGV